MAEASSGVPTVVIASVVLGLFGLVFWLAVKNPERVVEVDVLGGKVKFAAGALSDQELGRLKETVGGTAPVPPAPARLTPATLRRLVPSSELQRAATSPALASVAALRANSREPVPAAVPARATSESSATTELVAPEQLFGPLERRFLRPIRPDLSGVWLARGSVMRYEIRATASGCSFTEFVPYSEGTGTLVTAQGEGVQVGRTLFITYNTALGARGEARLTAEPDAQTMKGTFKSLADNSERSITLTRR
jgi:hypothetical protein